jgi:hypothetical protein
MHLVAKEMMMMHSSSYLTGMEASVIKIDLIYQENKENVKSLCPNGMWLTAVGTVKHLGLNNEKALKALIKMGTSHIHIEIGDKVAYKNPPYNVPFYYVTEESLSKVSADKKERRRLRHCDPFLSQITVS